MYDYFWWGKNVDPFLFKGFSVNSEAGLFGLCVVVFAMAFVFEYMKYLQTKHKQKELILRVKQLKLLCPTESASLMAQSVVDPKNPLNITLFDRMLLLGSEISFWLFLQILGYFLMLGVMIYNTWFLISAVIGGGLGYFIFGHLFMRLNIQNCQIMRSAFCTQICGETDVRDGQSTPAAMEVPSNSEDNSEYQLNCQNKVSAVTVHANCH